MRDLGDERVSRNFAGSLLVAHPNMVDPNFRRTVLFVSEHEPTEGALGVIINRPLDRPVAELVSEPPPAGLADIPVFLGGPVGKNQLMFAAFEWQKGAGLKLNQNIAFDEASHAQGHKNLLTVCAFVGYAGWGPGQLEAELHASAWLMSDVDRDLLFNTPAERMWEETIRRLGADPASLQMSRGVH